MQLLQSKSNNLPDSKWMTFGVLSVAHMMNDMYANFLPQLIPFLIINNVVSVSTGATLVAAFTITSSLLQPIFGYLVDIKGQRWLLYVGTLWMSILLSTTGLISNYKLLFAVAALSGMGTAAFHPQATGMIGNIRTSHKGFMLSIFVAVGNIGISVSPLIFMPLFHRYGTSASWVAIFPGIFISIFLYMFAPKLNPSEKSSSGMEQVVSSLKKAWKELSMLMLVVSVRSLVNTGMITLLPLYFFARKYSPETTSFLMFITLGMGVAGGILGGFISDRYGKKVLITASLAIAPIFFYGFLYTSGPFSFVLLALGGGTLLSSFSVTTAAAQEIIPENKALASGLSLGFAIGMGGLAVSPLGRYAEISGLNSAIHLIFILPVLGALLALFIKSETK